jgi:predicted DCC family thiol-disulfide oxidoreductase YuxK
MDDKTNGAFDIEVFFDGGCPLCAREVAWLRRRDRMNRLRFTDIDDPIFDAPASGKTKTELMARMHGRLPNGTWLCGVEVFRRIYTAIGWRSVAAISRLPVISQILEAGYWVFAKNRLRLTGRCASGECHVPHAISKNPPGSHLATRQ